MPCYLQRVLLHLDIRYWQVWLVNVGYYIDLYCRYLQTLRCGAQNGMIPHDMVSCLQNQSRDRDQSPSRNTREGKSTNFPCHYVTAITFLTMLTFPASLIMYQKLYCSWLTSFLLKIHHVQLQYSESEKAWDLFFSRIDPTQSC